MVTSPLRPAILALLGGAALIAIKHNGGRLSPSMTDFLHLFSILCFAVALFDALTLAVERWDLHMHAVRQRTAITAANELLRSLAGISPDAQAEIAHHIGALGIEWAILPTSAGPTYSASLLGVSIPQDFIIQFFEQSTTYYLLPVRRFGANTHERLWAQTLTDWLIRFDYATRAMGNKPAAWASDGYQRAKAAFFGKSI